MYSIEAKNVTYKYSIGTPYERVAVNDVSVAIEKGQYVGIIGHTGSGKSTLIQHFNGLLEPTSGEIYVNGDKMWEDKKKMRDFRFKVGLVFQYPEYQLFGETVYEDISFGPKNMGLDADEVDRRVRDAARSVGLKPEQLDKSPFELSGGQKRRVAIAGVMAMEPEVLILDEPTAGLDPKGRDVILGMIKEYHSEKKNTVLLVSHSMEDIAANANMALVMNKSHLFAYDTVENVFSRGDELASIGLSIPQVSRVFTGLNAKFPSIDKKVYTVEQAKQNILSILKSSKEGK